MKNVYIIGGTMGVSKTTCCSFLMNKLDDAIFLDGDWCWTDITAMETAEKAAAV